MQGTGLLPPIDCPHPTSIACNSTGTTKPQWRFLDITPFSATLAAENPRFSYMALHTWAPSRCYLYKAWWTYSPLLMRTSVPEGVNSLLICLLVKGEIITVSFLLSPVLISPCCTSMPAGGLREIRGLLCPSTLRHSICRRGAHNRTMQIAKHA